MIRSKATSLNDPPASQAAIARTEKPVIRAKNSRVTPSPDRTSMTSRADGGSFLRDGRGFGPSVGPTDLTLVFAWVDFGGDPGLPEICAGFDVFSVFVAAIWTSVIVSVYLALILKGFGVGVQQPRLHICASDQVTFEGSWPALTMDIRFLSPRRSGKMTTLPAEASIVDGTISRGKALATRPDARSPE